METGVFTTGKPGARGSTGFEEAWGVWGVCIDWGVWGVCIDWGVWEVCLDWGVWGVWGALEVGSTKDGGDDFIEESVGTTWLAGAPCENAVGKNDCEGSEGLAGFDGFEEFEGSNGFVGFGGFEGSSEFEGFRGCECFDGSEGSKGLEGSSEFEGFIGCERFTGCEGCDGFACSDGFAGSDGSTGSAEREGKRVPAAPADRLAGDSPWEKSASAPSSRIPGLGSSLSAQPAKSSRPRSAKSVGRTSFLRLAGLPRHYSKPSFDSTKLSKFAYSASQSVGKST